MRVLLVEDLKLAAKIAHYILTSLDCEVDVAYSGKQALEKISAQDSELVLMDIGLPDSSGFSVTQKIREVNQHIPVYALSAHTDDDHKRKAEQAGMNGFLIKPLEELEIKQVIRTHQPALI